MGRRNIQIKNYGDGTLDVKFLFITNKKNYKKKKAVKNFEKFVNEFESTYTLDELKNWCGNCNEFDEFKKKSKKILKN